MKSLTNVFYRYVALLLFVLLLAGCAEGEDDESKTNPSAKDSATQSEKETKNADESNKKENESASAMDDSDETSSQETGKETSHQPSDNEEDNQLSDYSSEEIEYARVWLQLGDIKDVDELNVRHIPTGTALNPDDETSANYPEDVIQLAGGRLVAGSVTYSGNGDGTINKYKVPLRWDGKNPAGKGVYKDIIKDTEQISIDPGDDDEIIELINKMTIH